VAHVLDACNALKHTHFTAEELSAIDLILKELD
jgi:hypothetical protein